MASFIYYFDIIEVSEFSLPMPLEQSEQGERGRQRQEKPEVRETARSQGSVDCCQKDWEVPLGQEANGGSLSQTVCQIFWEAGGLHISRYSFTSLHQPTEMLSDKLCVCVFLCPLPSFNLHSFLKIYFILARTLNMKSNLLKILCAQYIIVGYRGSTSLTDSVSLLLVTPTSPPLSHWHHLSTLCSYQFDYLDASCEWKYLQYLSCCDWLISLSMKSSRFIQFFM